MRLQASQQSEGTVTRGVSTQSALTFCILASACRYCLVQGAYRGAGADTIRARFAVDLGVPGGDHLLALLQPAGPKDGAGAGDGGWGGGQEGAPLEEGAAAGAGGPAAEAAAAAEEEELGRAVAAMAEMALLGAGHADDQFPRGLDAMYEAYADETPFRVML